MTDTPPRRRGIADIDLRSIAEALDEHDGMTQWWYDPTTGDVVPDVADHYDDEAQDDDSPDARGLVWIEPEPGGEAYAAMVDFAEAVGDRRARTQLVRALEGRGAFRRFKDTLFEFPELRQRWFDFEAAAADVRAIEWLRDADLVDDTDATTEITSRNAAADEILASVGARGLEIEASAVGERWPDIVAAIDTRRGVTVTRDGEAWAVIEPAE